MSGAGAIDRYLRRLADAPAGEERRVEDAVAPLTDLLPGARAVALESLDGRFTAVALAAADRRPVAAPPLGPLIRRVIAAGEAVHVRRGTGALYRDAALAAHLGAGELLVAAVAVRRDVVAALSLHADEITPGEREMLAHAAAAIGLWLTLSGPAPAPAVPPAARLRDARALAAEGRAGAALTAAGRALGLRADLAPAGERVAVMRTCSCPHHREIPVAGAGEALGRVLVHGWAPIADDAAEELAAVARTALLAERLARRDELPLADRLDDLGGASDPPWRAVGRVTRADLAAPLTVLLAAGGDRPAGERDLLGAVGAALGAGAARTPVGARPGELLAVLPRHDEAAARRVAERIVAEGRRRGLELACAVSRAGAAADLHALVDEAERLARLAAVLGRRGGVTAAADAGVDGLLLEVGRGEPLEAFARRLIGPLIEYDARHGGDLVGTLGAYLASWGQLRRCAASLYVHPNTLKYRIGRIAAILGVDPRDPAVRTDLLLACHAHRVARALDGSAPMSYGRPHRPTTGADRDERRRTTM